jgi:hypothetical protein
MMQRHHGIAPRRRPVGQGGPDRGARLAPARARVALSSIGKGGAVDLNWPPAAPGARSSSSGMPEPADDLADTSIDVAQLVGDGRDRGDRAPGARASLFSASRHTHVLKPVDFGPVCA